MNVNKSLFTKLGYFICSILVFASTLSFITSLPGKEPDDYECDELFHPNSWVAFHYSFGEGSEITIHFVTNDSEMNLNFFACSENNLDSFIDGSQITRYNLIEGLSNATINFIVPYNGRWCLVFENPQSEYVFATLYMDMTKEVAYIEPSDDDVQDDDFEDDVKFDYIVEDEMGQNFAFLGGFSALLIMGFICVIGLVGFIVYVQQKNSIGSNNRYHQGVGSNSNNTEVMITLVCPNCHTPLLLDDVYCSECGRKI